MYEKMNDQWRGVWFYQKGAVMIKSHDAHDVRIGFFVAEWVLDIVCVIFTEDQ